MIWKAIGKSVIGTSHIQNNKLCEDALVYTEVIHQNESIFIAIASDGAGSALFANQAAELIVNRGTKILIDWILNDLPINEAAILALAEILYDELAQEADNCQVPLNEFSSTFLGAVLYKSAAIFFQSGDGVIIRDDGIGGYAAIWWPQNGEYINTTSFLIEDKQFPNLKISLIHEQINEIAILTDGLQMLTLNTETLTVHQPFFTSLFKWLRLAIEVDDVLILNEKLSDYLSSEAINDRTDDDKTLLLATRISN